MSFPRCWRTLLPWVWLAPALLLVFFFLILPAVQTLHLSLFRRVRITPAHLETKLQTRLPGWKQLPPRAAVSNLRSWEQAIQKLADGYGVRLTNHKPMGRLQRIQFLERLSMRLRTSLRQQGKQRRFVGLGNYLRLFEDQGMLTALRNNLLWLVLFTAACIGLGLLLAALTLRVSWGARARSALFLPMAISYVAAGVIWTLMYQKDPTQGTVNALLSLPVSLFGGEYQGIAFLGRPQWVTPALIVAGVWMWTGFCTVLFAAALNAVPGEIKQAARIDGAGERTIFFRIELPMIKPTFVVVGITMVINVLKVFDIVYTMTRGGPFGSSEVLANAMYRTAFVEGNLEYASAMAVLLLVAVLPVLLFNIRNLRHQGGTV